MCMALPIPCPTYSSMIPYGPAARTDASTACGDVGEPVAGLRLGQALPERGFAHLEQPGQLGGDLPHADGEGRVPVPAVDDGAAVDGDDVALAQHDVRAGDAVHDDLVDRGADRRPGIRGSP